MIEVKDKSRCTGCTACLNKCPLGCISMNEDHEGFLYPTVDDTRCIGCDECVRVCPFNSPNEKSVLTAYAVRTDYENVASSGGALAAVAENWVRNGGCVYGAAYDDSLDVCHLKGETSEDVARFRTSKYVQSRMGDCFLEIQALLSGRRKVLFIGTPCQVAGLKAYVGHDDNLLTVQLACHGVPSPKLWRSYLSAIEKKMGDKILSVNFRDKSKGWKNYHVAYVTSSDVTRVSFDKDPYMLAYLQNISLRPSCYDCGFRGSTFGDIAAGDLWNISEVLPEYEDGKGYTLLVVHSDAGKEVIEGLMSDNDQTKCIPVDYTRATEKNSGFGGEISVPEKRDEFFHNLYVSGDIAGYMNGFVQRKARFEVLYAKIHTFLSCIKKKIKG